MKVTVIFINLLAISGLLIAFVKDKDRTRQSVIIAIKSFSRILPSIFIVIILIGVFIGFVPANKISEIVGEQSGPGGIFLIALLGSVLHIPALLSFPLAASFLKNGASITAVAAFITTLTMIGTVTLPLEIKELGRKMALLRNGISFIIAIIIAFIMGAIL